jgi:hypothetical protein
MSDIGDYRLERTDRGLYQLRLSDIGEHIWVRVATYPPYLNDIDDVLDWYFPVFESDDE